MKGPGAGMSHREIAGAIRPAPGSRSGWGLYLVELLSTRWGHGTGRYWFELEIEDHPAGGTF